MNMKRTQQAADPRRRPDDHRSRAAAKQTTNARRKARALKYNREA